MRLSGYACPERSKAKSKGSVNNPTYTYLDNQCALYHALKFGAFFLSSNLLHFSYGLPQSRYLSAGICQTILYGR